MWIGEQRTHNAEKKMKEQIPKLAGGLVVCTPDGLIRHVHHQCEAE